MTLALHFAQISDIHLSTLGNYEEILSGQAADFLAEVLTSLNKQEDLDFVLFTGDLFNIPTDQNVTLFQQVVQLLHKPYYIIPGNHDRRDLNSSEGLTQRHFAQLFNPQLKDRPSAPTLQAGYWSVTVNPRVQLIGLDSIRATDWGGFIDEPQVVWLKDQLVVHRDKFIILAVHHPFHRLAPIDDHPHWRNFVCDDGPDMLRLLDQYPQVKLVLTGHHHQTKADLLGARLHLACPALAVYPCAYRTLHLFQLDERQWHVEWQTYPATDEPTIAQARQMMLQAWVKVGFDPAFVELHTQLAAGSVWDQRGMARW
jgi:3',5'-cyclic AMP phosphodiesterase CpdA